MRRSLVFAYGSNLDEAQLLGRCPRARVLTLATLPNHRLVFAGRSARWGAAVASVERAPGAAVQGTLIELDEEDLGALDRCEGHPRVYDRVRRHVTDARGGARDAQVYVHTSSERGAPSEGYLALIWRAYRRLGLDVEPLARAAGARCDAATRVFVYGTLLAGEPNHHLLARARLLCPTETQPGFELRHLGGFPGLVRGGAQAVVGEVYEVDDATLAALDRLEGHPTFYRRTSIAVGGESVDAYMLLRAQVEGCPVITSGSWRER